jgi:hypothetical protein
VSVSFYLTGTVLRASEVRVVREFQR